MRMRFLNMADFWVAMLCGLAGSLTCEEVILWLHYMELSAEWLETRQVYSGSTKDVPTVCSVSFFMGALQPQGWGQVCTPRRVGWLWAASETWSWSPQSLHRGSASVSVTPCMVSPMERLCRIRTGVSLQGSFRGFLVPRLTCRVATMSTQCKVRGKVCVSPFLSTRST